MAFQSESVSSASYLRRANCNSSRGIFDMKPNSGQLIVSEITAQLIPQIYFAVISWSRITERIPTPIFAVIVLPCFIQNSSLQKKLPSAKTTELIPAGTFAVISRWWNYRMNSLKCFLCLVFLLVTIVLQIFGHFLIMESPPRKWTLPPLSFTSPDPWHPDKAYCYEAVGPRKGCWKQCHCLCCKGDRDCSQASSRHSPCSQRIPCIPFRHPFLRSTVSQAYCQTQLGTHLRAPALWSRPPFTGVPEGPGLKVPHGALFEWFWGNCLRVPQRVLFECFGGTFGPKKHSKKALFGALWGRCPKALTLPQQTRILVKNRSF